MPPPRKIIIIRVEAAPDVPSRVDAITDKRGMTQISLFSRMVKWLARQDEGTQMDILNTVGGESLQSQKQRLLKRLASQAPKE